MNSVLLFLIAIPVFVLGYRYYAKYLLLTDTVPQDDRVTAAGTGDGHDLAAVPRWSLLAQHWASVSGATTVVGVALALLWGWIPAFLWITCGSVIGAGVYAMGVQWWSLRHGAADPASATRATLGPAAGWAPAVFMARVLTCLGGWLVYLVARLLAANPALVLPVGLFVTAAAALGRFAPARRGVLLYLCIPVALIVLLMVWPAQSAPLAVDGGLDLRLAGHTLLHLDAASLWAAAALLYAVYAARAPIARLAQPQALLAAVMAVALLFASTVALSLVHPALVAPNFNDAASRPALPWLFLVLGGGTLAGFQGLFAAGVAATRLERERDLRAVGYGAALADGFLALLVLAICAAGFTGTEAWQGAYAGWDPLYQPQAGLDILFAALGHVAAAAGAGPESATALWAMLLVVLALCTLEAVLRLLRRILKATLAPHLPALSPRPQPWGWWSAAPLALLVFADGNGLGGVAGWPLLLLSALLLAALMLATCLLSVMHERRPGIPLPLPAVIALVLGNWALVSALIEWWVAGSVPLLAAGALLLALELWWLAAAARACQTRLRTG